MLLNVYGGIVIIVLLLLPLLLPSFPWLLAKFLFNPLGHVGVNVLGQVIFAVETFTALGASMHFVRPMND